MKIKFKDWLNSVKKTEKEFDNLVNKNEITIFYVINGELFGGNEKSRILFSKLKNNDYEQEKILNPNFKNDSRFLAYNILKSLIEPDLCQVSFSIKDIPNIKIFNKEEIIKLMLKRL